MSAVQLYAHTCLSLHLSVNRRETEGRLIKCYQSVFYLPVSTSNPTTRYESLWRKMHYFIRLWTIKNTASLACSPKTKSIIIFISQIQIYAIFLLMVTVDEEMFIKFQRHWKFLRLTMVCPSSAHWIIGSEIQTGLLLSELAQLGGQDCCVRAYISTLAKKLFIWTYFPLSSMLNKFGWSFGFFQSLFEMGQSSQVQKTK